MRWKSILLLGEIQVSGGKANSGRPDGTKKAYVRLTADVDALDTANKVFISSVTISNL